ncbi:MBL fold metallo-hydrolase [Bacteroidetes/Chlorobi group bacterium Naka2016]|jgi:glyoxylase-like metal-dependent hydrolase (beta-lactamase superfamily II)|nr:MAG: MBL fold metallo-hydrolase [Bacteroidetes/Chlorobi group bacterium Naka2016]
MKVIPVVAGILETNCFLVVNEGTKTALLFDAPPQCKNIIMSKMAEEDCTLEAILLTHTHWDHTADANPLKQETGAKVYVHSADYYRLQEPMKHTIFELDFNIEPCEADVLLQGGETIQFRTTTLRVLHTPGHTEGSVAFVCDELQCAFVGDTIFYLSVGRTDLPGGDENLLQESLGRILNELPENYKLYVGHNQETTVGFERSYNPYLMLI